MRTKALLLTAALGAAGIATSMAQVYSVNAVGYINVAIAPAGFPTPGPKLTLIANQLNQVNSTIGALIPVGTPGVPDGTILYKYNNTTHSFGFNTYDLSGIGDWDNPSETLQPGDAAFLLNPGPAFTVTFVGDVPTGTLNTTIPAGYSGLSSKVPQAGAVSTLLGLPSNDGQVVYKWRVSGQTYDFFTEDLTGIGAWDPSEPEMAVGEGFLLLRGAGQGGTWTRTFNVN